LGGVGCFFFGSSSLIKKGLVFFVADTCGMRPKMAPNFATGLKASTTSNDTIHTEKTHFMVNVEEGVLPSTNRRFQGATTTSANGVNDKSLARAIFNVRDF